MLIPTRIVADVPDLEPRDLGLSLPSAAAGNPSAEVLTAFARSLAFPPEAWSRLAPHLTFDARQYRRVRLYRGAEWEALLLCWLPGQATNIHDHGGSVGVSAVIAGTLHETRFERRADGRPLAVAGRTDCPTGSAAVELVDTIHEIRNASDAPAVSLHLYSPPLTVLGAYDAERGTRWDVPVADSPDVQVGGNPSLTP